MPGAKFWGQPIVLFRKMGYNTSNHQLKGVFVMLMPINQQVTSIYNYGLRPPASVRAGRPTGPMTPVSPVRPVTAVYVESPGRVGFSTGQWASAYHAEQANRVRVQYADRGAAYPAGSTGTPAPAGEPAQANVLPAAYPAEMAARMRVNSPADQEAGMLGAQGAQKAADEGRCETCEKRKYQDGSDDSSVSYQTPTRIDPAIVASAVRGHEMEHVYHEQAKAKQEGRKVVSQTVTLHTDICPECGRSYISGGTTRTVTKAVDGGKAGETQQAEA